MLYRLVKLLDWAYHASGLDYRAEGWSWICDKREAMNAEEGS